MKKICLKSAVQMGGADRFTSPLVLKECSVQGMGELLAVGDSVQHTI